MCLLNALHAFAIHVYIADELYSTWWLRNKEKMHTLFYLSHKQKSIIINMHRSTGVSIRGRGHKGAMAPLLIGELKNKTRGKGRGLVYATTHDLP